MRRALALVLVALALPTAAGQAVEGVRTLAWHLPECRMAVAFVDAEPADVKALLPPGFEPVTWGALGKAKVLVEFASCGALEYGNWEALVVPPAALAGDDADAHYVKFDVLVQDATTRETLVAWGLPARDGRARVEAGAVPGVYAARMEMEGVGAFALDFAVTSEPPAPADFPFLEFTPTTSGDLATWDVALRDLALGQGTGVLTLPPGSRLAALAGATQVPVDVLSGRWSALDGVVTTPAGELAFAVGGGRPAVAVAAAVAGGAVGLGALWRALRWVGAASAYSRITRAGVAEHPRRRKILALVRERPGILASELARATRYAPGVLAHHLHLLERHGHVVRIREGARTRLVEAGARAEPYLPPARARVLALVRARPGIGRRALAADAGLSRWTVAYHLRHLARAGLVEDVPGATGTYRPR